MAIAKKAKMFKARGRLVFISAYEHGRAIHGPMFPEGEQVQQPGESSADLDARLWPYKAHFNDKGHVVAPAMSLKNMIDGAAAYLGMKVAGKGQRKYGGIFKPGVLVIDSPEVMRPDEKGKEVPYTKENMRQATYLIGQKKKDFFSYPQFYPAYVDAEFHIIDKDVTEDVFKKHLEAAGLFVGLGRWRVGRGGPHGRFTVSDYNWEPVYE